MLTKVLTSATFVPDNENCLFTGTNPIPVTSILDPPVGGINSSSRAVGFSSSLNYFYRENAAVSESSFTRPFCYVLHSAGVLMSSYHSCLYDDDEWYFTSGLGSSGVSSVYYVGTRLLLEPSSGSIKRSDDGGITWVSDASLPRPVDYWKSGPTTTIYGVSASTVHSTTDGITWTPYALAFTPVSSLRAGSNVILSAISPARYYSTDTTFSSISGPYNGTQFAQAGYSFSSTIKRFGSSFFVMGTKSGDTVNTWARTSSDGITWSAPFLMINQVTASNAVSLYGSYIVARNTSTNRYYYSTSLSGPWTLLDTTPQFGVANGGVTEGQHGFIITHPTSGATTFYVTEDFSSYAAYNTPHTPANPTRVVPRGFLFVTAPGKTNHYIERSINGVDWERCVGHYSSGSPIYDSVSKIISTSSEVVVIPQFFPTTPALRSTDGLNFSDAATSVSGWGIDGSNITTISNIRKTVSQPGAILLTYNYTTNNAAITGFAGRISTDGGVSWTNCGFPVSSGVGHFVTYDEIVGEFLLFRNNLTSTSIYTSATGTSWSLSHNILSLAFVDSVMAGGVHYGLTSNNNIYTSTDRFLNRTLFLDLSSLVGNDLGIDFTGITFRSLVLMGGQHSLGVFLQWTISSVDHYALAFYKNGWSVVELDNDFFDNGTFGFQSLAFQDVLNGWIVGSIMVQ